MSTYYIMHTEAKVGDKWHLIDPMVLKIGKEKNEYVRIETMWRQSTFRQAFEKIEEIGEVVDYKDLSEELKAKLNREIEEDGDVDSYFQIRYISVPLHRIAELSNGFTHYGMVKKSHIQAFEDGEMEELWPLDLGDLEGYIDIPEDDDKAEKTEQDFAKLVLSQNLEKLGYVYHEWDDAYDWKYNFKLLKERCYANLNNFMEANYLWGEPDVRVIAYWC